MACSLLGAKPLPERMQIYCQLDPLEQISVIFELEYNKFSFRKIHLKMLSAKMAILSENNL